MGHLGLPVDLSPARRATELQGEFGDLHDDNTICLKQFARLFWCRWSSCTIGLHTFTAG